jgi:DNA-binding XRE family transcriptional regulator
MAAGRKDHDALAWFADELRAHRNTHGWTQADLAAKISYSESLIAQVETGRKAPTPELARALDRVFATPGFTEDALGVPDTPGTFGRLVVRLRNLPFPAAFRSFAPHEAEATALYTFEHSFIPGLLQTQAYARAVLEAYPDATEDVVSERLAGRLSRQAILEREDPPPPVVCALIDQSALNREIGGSVVMRDQLVQLVAMSHRPNITVQIIPNAGTHPGLLGAFTVADLGGSPGVARVRGNDQRPAAGSTG